MVGSGGQFWVSGVADQCEQELTAGPPSLSRWRGQEAHGGRAGPGPGGALPVPRGGARREPRPETASPGGPCERLRRRGCASRPSPARRGAASAGVGPRARTRSGAAETPPLPRPFPS